MHCASSRLKDIGTTERNGRANAAFSIKNIVTLPVVATLREGCTMQHALSRYGPCPSPSQPSSAATRVHRLRLLPACTSSSGRPWASSSDRNGEVIDVKAIEVVESSASSSQASSSGPKSVQSAQASSSTAGDETAPQGAQQQPWQREQRRAEAMQRLLTRRVRQIRSGRWLTPEPSAGSEAGGSSGDKVGLQARSPVVTYLLACTAFAAFMQQWWPLLPLLLEHAQQLDFAPLAALALVVPDTPAAGAWQLDVMAVSAGNWVSVWTSCFVHTGLLPLMLCTASLLDVGARLEGAFGGLVLALHFGLCGLGAALAQLTLQPLVFGIAGPGVAAGLVISLLVHQARLRSEGQLPGLHITPLSACVLAMCTLLALFQPLLGLWGLLGACLGGAVAALSWFALLNALRYCIFGPLYLLVCALELAFQATTAIPKAVTFCITGVMRVMVQLLAVVASTIRDIK